MMLHSYVDDFSNALALFNYADDRIRFAMNDPDSDPDVTHLMAGWGHIAARDAAMTIYHFSIILNAIHSRCSSAQANQRSQHQ
jgi:hypothetical protein